MADDGVERVGIAALLPGEFGELLRILRRLQAEHGSEAGSRTFVRAARLALTAGAGDEVAARVWAEEQASDETQQATPAQPVKRGRGRPKGSSKVPLGPLKDDARVVLRIKRRRDETITPTAAAGLVAEVAHSQERSVYGASEESIKRRLIDALAKGDENNSDEFSSHHDPSSRT